MDPLFDAARSLRPDYARVDWAATALGPVPTWSPPLRAAVDLVLGTRFAVTLLWGPQLVMVYNDAYRAMIGDKHPAALGAPARDVFPEIWDTIGPMLDTVMAGGTVWTQNERLLLLRRGFLEEAFFTFSYSPVRDADGTVLGAMDIATESTEQVHSLRRLATVTQLSESLSRPLDAGELRERALPVLRTAGEDLVAVDILATGEASDAPRLLHTGAFAGPPDGPRDGPPGRGDALQLQQTPDGVIAWLPLSVPGLGERWWLVVRLSPHVPLDDGYRAFLRLLASSLVTAMDRSRVREMEHRQAEASRAASETFQRSLLSAPTVPRGYELAVHYRPAAAEAKVGGDWYDAFRLADGTVTVVVGDVTGHDLDSAAAMAQVRNLLRGVSYTVSQGPAGVLRALDDAMRGLHVQSLATAVVGQVQPAGEVTWTNAGHPPPVLIGPDGTARLLSTAPEILLGVRAPSSRTDHRLTLEPGATLVLYTDGLIERRGEPFDVSTAQLAETLAGSHRVGVDGVCALLLEHYAGDADDDIVLLVLRRRAD